MSIYRGEKVGRSRSRQQIDIPYPLNDLKYEVGDKQKGYSLMARRAKRMHKRLLWLRILPFGKPLPPKESGISVTVLIRIQLTPISEFIFAIWNFFLSLIFPHGGHLAVNECYAVG